jgi:hypothetical protein
MGTKADAVFLVARDISRPYWDRVTSCSDPSPTCNVARAYAISGDTAKAAMIGLGSYLAFGEPKLFAASNLPHQLLKHRHLTCQPAEAGEFDKFGATSTSLREAEKS